MTLIYFFRIFVTKSILQLKMFSRKGENNSLAVSLVQGELYSESNQYSCRDPIPSHPHSYTEPIITVQRFQQLGSLFFGLCNGSKHFEMCM